MVAFRTLTAAVVRLGLAAVCVLPAWFVAGTPPELQTAVAVLVCVLAVVGGLRVLAGFTRPRLPFLTLLVLAGACWGAFQLFPLPSALTAKVAPLSYRLWTRLTDHDSSATQVGQPPGRDPSDAASSVDGKADAAASPGWSVSLYPCWTRRAIWSLLLCAALVTSASTEFGDPSAAKWLLAVVVVNGAALCVLGLAQQLSGTDKIYGFIPLPPDGGSPFGPFVNRNNAAGFLNMCLACAVGAGWLGWQVGGSSSEGRSRSTWRSPLRFSVRRRLVEFAATLTGSKLFFPAAGVFLVAGIASSLSRGGTLAMLCLLATAAVVIVGRRTGRVWLVLLFAVLAVGLLSWLGRIDPIHERLSTLRDVERAGGGRLNHWSDSLRLFRDAWPTGMGLGTYRFVYVLAERHAIDGWFYHAENLFVETAVELGAFGVALLLGAIWLVARAAVRLLRSERAEAVALGLTACTLLAGQVVSGSFDFGLYIPANTYLMAVLCGAVVGAAIGVRGQTSDQFRTDAAVSPPDSHQPQQGTSETQAAGGGSAGRDGLSHSPSKPWGARLATTLTLCLLAVGSAVGAYELQAVRALKKVDRLLRDEFAKGDVEVPADKTRRIRRWLQDALAVAPDDAEAHWRLAEWYIHEFRRQAVDRLLESRPELGSRDKAWPLTDLLNLHRLVRELERLGDQQGLRSVRESEAVLQCLRPAWRELLEARRHCPLLARVHLTLAQLDAVLADGSHELDHLRRVVLTKPGRIRLVFTAGLVAWQSGQVEAAAELWRHCLKLSNRVDRVVAAFVQADPRLAAKLDVLVPDDPAVLVRLATQSFTNESARSIRERLLSRATKLLEAKGGALSAEEHQLLGVAAAGLGRTSTADRHFQAALAEQPDNEKWRRQYADFLRRQRRWEEAVRQYYLCRLVSKTPELYDRLIAETRKERSAALREKTAGQPFGDGDRQP